MDHKYMCVYFQMYTLFIYVCVCKQIAHLKIYMLKNYKNTVELFFPVHAPNSLAIEFEKRYHFVNPMLM